MLQLTNLKSKNMKKITLLMAAMLMAILTIGQSATEEVDLVQAAFGMEKKAIVAAFVQPTDIQQDAFWSLYDEYETKRKDNGKKRIDLLLQYVDVYESMNAEQADAWTKEVIKLSAATDKLIATYYKKIAKATSPVVATQFYQVEVYILTGLRAEILDEVPFLGE